MTTIPPLPESLTHGIMGNMTAVDFKVIVKGIAPIRKDKLLNSLNKGIQEYARNRLPYEESREEISRIGLRDIRCFNKDRKGVVTDFLGIPIRAYCIEAGDDYPFIKRVYVLTGGIARERWILTEYKDHITCEQSPPDLTKAFEVIYYDSQVE